MPTTVAPRGRSITVNVGKQTVDFKTPATTYLTTFILSHTLEGKQPFVDDPLLGTPRTNDRDAIDPAPGLMALAGPVVVPLDFNHIGLWLDAAFGSATITGSADPYTHVFVSGGENLPWLTAEVHVKVAAGDIFMQYLGLVLSKFTLEVARLGGYGKLTCEMIGRTETKLTASVAGTPATPWVRAPIVEAIGAFTMGGVNAANILKVMATYDNKLKPQDFVDDPLISGIDLDGESSFSGTIQLRFRDTTFYDQAISGAPFDGAIVYTTGVGRLLKLEAPRMFLERTGVAIPGPAGIDQTFNFRCAQDVSAPMLTATLKSLVPSYN